MKELSIKEKAKAYDKAIEKFGVILNLNTVKESGTIFADDVRKIFSELAESEDERIRKDIIEAVELHKDFTQKRKEDIYAWLDEQSGNPFSGVSIKYNGNTWGMCAMDNGVDISFNREFIQHVSIKKQSENSVCKVKIGETYKCVASPKYTCFHKGDIYHVDDNFVAELINICSDCFVLLENQCEQKPCMIQWKGDNLKEVIDFTDKDKNFEKWFKSFEEYEKYVHEHNDIFKLFNEDGSHYEVPVGAWIVKTPDGYNVASKAVLKQKPWSEDDEKKITYLDGLVGYQSCLSSDEKKDFYRWFKSLKDRVKPQPQWSEEDSKMVEDIVKNLKKCQLQMPDYRIELQIRLLNRLKFICTWKPSKEQVNTLWDVIVFVEGCNSNFKGSGSVLENLYNDLKKLREE